jgi:hypothetical protein
MEVMKQIHKPYYTWECYKNGMFDIDKKQNEDLLIKKSELLLCNEDVFFKISLLVLNEWKNSTDNNLSNKNINRNSWIGQSACSYNHKCPELLTRIAWGNISELQRNKANNVAKKIIKIYEDKNRKIYTGLGKQMLFEWNT